MFVVSGGGFISPELYYVRFPRLVYKEGNRMEKREFLNELLTHTKAR